jgi:arylsulfatase A-like enzyme
MSSFDRRAVLAGTVATLTATQVRAAPPRRPNFLFILADDMGWADLSCYGREDYRTPALDKLAGQGLRLTHAYANSAVCTASRVALITGRYQYRLPIGLEEPLAGRDVGLPPDVPTLPSRLRAAGYATSLVGKWHLGELPRYGPLKSGYERFWGHRGGAVDFFTHAGLRGKSDLWDQDQPIAAQGYLTDLLGDRAIAELEGFARGRRPFLLSLHFNAPHWPWEGPDDAAESRRLVDEKLPLASFDAGNAATYARMVVRMDLQIGRVLAALKRLGLERDTVVVFTSDNGGERFAKTWPFTGRKTELLEGGIRVPALVRWPGTTRAGAVGEAVSIHMDWAPTFCAAAGADLADFDGQDLRPMLSGAAAPDRTLFWRYKSRAQRAVRQGRWKYLKIADNEFLFDVVADPLERANWMRRDPARFAALKAAWEAWDKTMLPLDPKSLSGGFSGDELADHFDAED